MNSVYVADNLIKKNIGVEVKTNFPYLSSNGKYEKHDLKARRAVRTLTRDFGLSKNTVSEFYQFFASLPDDVKRKLTSNQIAETFSTLKLPVPLQ